MLLLSALPLWGKVFVVAGSFLALAFLHAPGFSPVAQAVVRLLPPPDRAGLPNERRRFGVVPHAVSSGDDRLFVRRVNVVFHSLNTRSAHFFWLLDSRGVCSIKFFSTLIDFRGSKFNLLARGCPFFFSLFVSIFSFLFYFLPTPSQPAYQALIAFQMFVRSANGFLLIDE
jgi:hypothetical protein